MVSIPISTNIVKTIANLIYYLYSDNGNKQYRRMQTNKTSTRKRTTERETCQPYNIDQVIVNNTGKCVRDELQKKESNIDRQTVKKEDNHDHNNLVSYQCIKYFTKLTKIFLHLITATANAYYIRKILRDRNYNTSGLSAGLASNNNYHNPLLRPGFLCVY